MVKYAAGPLDRTFAALADPTRRRILEEWRAEDRRFGEAGLDRLDEYLKQLQQPKNRT